MTIAEVYIPTSTGDLRLEFTAGSSTVFIGANGAGKTRLGVFVESKILKGNEVHRIAAHRSLTMNTNVMPPRFDVALNRLRFGHDHSDHKGARWNSRPATEMLSDFDHLIAALYAEENNISVRFRQEYNMNPGVQPATTKLDILREIWKELLPHRQLIAEASNIKTKANNDDASEYNSSEMSDGERVIFYLIGQSLLASEKSILIIDEPELHINKSIMAKLWDKIEAARSDCCLIYITHDVEFASSRHAASKFVVRSYQKSPERWDIELVPEGMDIPEDVVALILGSRQPVLFIEGDGSSLDIALYRRVFDKFTVIPVGSSEHVIHSVVTFVRRKELHRIGCAGIIDADGRSENEADNLRKMGVYTLPVSEVENLILLPNVFFELAKSLQFSSSEATEKLGTLKGIVLKKANTDIDRICLDYTKRRIDVHAKKIGLNSKSIADLNTEFANAVGSIDPNTIFAEIKMILESAISSGDYETVLKHYDNKGLLDEAAALLGYQKRKSLEEFIGRAMRGVKESGFLDALIACLPAPVPRPQLK